MTFKQELERLQNSEIFKRWKHKNCYLAHGFLMIKGDVKSSWQIGYYDKKADKVIPFMMDEEIKKSEPADVFKKDGSVNELDLSKVNIDMEEALKTAKQRAKEKFNYEGDSQVMVILQNIEAGQVWNITFLKGVDVLNFKIDTDKGNVVDEKKTSFLSPKAS